jgi:hypothetical protein
MLISLHKQATTTLKIRTSIQGRLDLAQIAVELFGISGQSVLRRL